MPLSFSVFVYHHKWLGISKLAEIRKVNFETMYDYIKEKHGIYLLE